MKHSRTTLAASPAWSVFPELAPVNESKAERLRDRFRRAPAKPAPVLLLTSGQNAAPAKETTPKSSRGHLKAEALSFLNMSRHGDLLVSFMKARKETFIDRLGWDLPEADGMEFDQYDTPQCRWVVIHEFGEILAGIRLLPTTAKCGVYSYMLRDAQSGLLHNIPNDVLFFEAPVDTKIWEASRLFIAESVPSARRASIQGMLMEKMTETAHEAGALHVIGIVPAVWARWLRRIGLDAVPVGPKFDIDGTVTQAALFNVRKNGN